MSERFTKENAQQNALTTKKTAETVKILLLKNKEALLRSMPKGFNFDRMLRTVINAISTNGELAKCDSGSIFLSTIRAFALGLEPNGPLSEGYLIPFWNGKKKRMEAQFMPSYRGLQNLARRSGEILDIYAKKVCEKDFFEVEEGTDRKLIHKPNYREDRGAAFCYYAVFRTKDGGTDFEVMSKNEIEKVRKSSKASENGPWVDWYDEMAEKTVTKRLLKRAPMSIELAGAIAAENKASMGEDSGDILDIEGIEFPDEKHSVVLNREINAAEPKAALPEKTDLEKVAEKISETGCPVSAEEVKAYVESRGEIFAADMVIPNLNAIAEAILNGGKGAAK